MSSGGQYYYLPRRWASRSSRVYTFQTCSLLHSEYVSFLSGYIVVFCVQFGYWKISQLPARLISCPIVCHNACTLIRSRLLYTRDDETVFQNGLFAVFQTAAPEWWTYLKESVYSSPPLGIVTGEPHLPTSVSTDLPLAPVRGLSLCTRVAPSAHTHASLVVPVAFVEGWSPTRSRPRPTRCWVTS